MSLDRPLPWSRLRGPVLRAVASGGILLYSVGLGVLAGKGRETLALLAVALPVGLLLLTLVMYRFTMAVLALPIVTLWLPFYLPTGTGSLPPASLLFAMLLVVVWLVGMAVRRRWELRPSPLNRPLLLLGAVMVASLIWGVLWRDPVLNVEGGFLLVQVGSLVTYLMSIGAALLVGNMIATPGQLRYLVGLFLVSLSLMSAIFFFGVSQPIFVIAGLWGMWLLVLAFSLMLAQPRLGYWRLVLFALICFTFYKVAYRDSYWVSGWLPALIAMVVVVFLHSRRLFIGMLFCAALAYAPVIHPYIDSVVQENTDEGSDGRLTIWQVNARLVGEHWLLGTGPAGYAPYYMTYHPEQSHSSHNNYLDIASQFGVLGLLSWAWLALTGIWEGWRLTRAAPPGLLRTTAIAATGGWVGALAAMMLGDWVLPFAYNVTIAGYRHTVYTWIFLGTLIAIRALIERQVDHSTVPYLGQGIR